jgi:cell division protease FtsH
VADDRTGSNAVGSNTAGSNVTVTSTATAVAAPVLPQLMGSRDADVGRSRETSRRRRLRTFALVVGPIAGYLWYRILSDDAFNVFALPSIDPLLLVPILFFSALLLLILGTTIGAGRSPHVVYRPEQIDTRLDDVIGVDAIKEDVLRSLNLFLAHKAFAKEMGGTPRRGLLFEGAPGTGKTHLAKAMAAEAGVPFLFVSATSFQSMYYGATARKIRSYFKALRKAARQEGGAIGFIEEIDAIAIARGGLSMTPSPLASQSVGAAAMTSHSCGAHLLPMHHDAGAQAPATVSSPMVSEGVGGVVNELLVQMQSFDDPTGLQKLRASLSERLNLFLPANRQIRRPQPPSTNVLLIAATNRADNLDPALLRPGRFDRRLTFELPTKSGRIALIEHFLARKSHDAALDTPEARDRIASATNGYTPVMIEHLFDEALVNAMRRGAPAMSMADVERARLVEEVGMGQPVEYTDHERRLIATHESGHAAAAYLFAPHRRLEILTIIKRRQALGLLAHGDVEDVYTQSRAELIALIRIALAGQCAEEIFFGDVSTGPGGDLLYATNVAAQMVGAVGMLGSLVSFAAIQNSGFSDSNLVGRVLGDSQGRTKVEELLQEQKLVVRATLEDNRHLVIALRDALLERSELVGTEITDVLVAAQRTAGPRAAAPGSVPAEGAPPVEIAAPAEIDLRDPAPAPVDPA